MHLLRTPGRLDEGFARTLHLYEQVKLIHTSDNGTTCKGSNTAGLFPIPLKSNRPEHTQESQLRHAAFGTQILPESLKCVLPKIPDIFWGQEE